jgi:HTH-type transcriptional regulator/antitoxin HipB
MRVKTAKDLGNLVHDRRKALSMTQAELAARTGVSRLWVNQVEAGHGGAALAKVLQLVSELGMAVNLDLARPTDAAEVVVERTAPPLSTTVRPTTVTAKTGMPRTQVSGGAAMKMAMPKARPVNRKSR